MKQLLESGLAQLGLAASDRQLSALEDYARLLLEQNRVMNLTAITQPDEVAKLHFLDCAALLRHADFHAKRVVDVGTGAGFPGIVLKILEPSLQLTLLDSLNKRLDWLGAVCGSLGLTGVTLLPGRAEELSRRPDLRDAFDLATARAVAPLRLLSELCLPFVRPGGRFLAMKAVDSAQELQEAEPAIRLLQGRPLPPAEYGIPHTDITRRVLLVEKLAPTPDVYPRRWAKMQKVPL